MWIGVVHGAVTATVKHEALRRAKLLIVQPIHAVTGEAEGFAQVAVDTLGAGIGQRVLVWSDGLGTQRILGSDKYVPVRLAIGAGRLRLARQLAVEIVRCRCRLVAARHNHDLSRPMDLISQHREASCNGGAQRSRD